MAVLPAEIPTGLVQGQFYFVNEDNIDADTDPELQVVAGKVTFTCEADRPLRMPTKKAVVIPLTFDAEFDSQGRLVPEGRTEVGIEIPASDSLLFNPTNFTWKVEFNLVDVSTGFTVVIPSFSIIVPGGVTSDLVDLMPVSTAPGTITVQGPQGIQGPIGNTGPVGAGVPAGGTALQYIRKDAANTTTEWATLNAATGSVPGTMSAADKAKLDAATVAATASTIVIRDGNGAINIAATTIAGHAARKDYVDGMVWDGSDITTGTVAAAHLPVSTGSVPGTMSAADKAKLDAATSAPTNSTMAMRNSAGRIQVAEPGTDTAAATSKNYVDTAVATKANTAHTHDAADVATGVLLPARLPAATGAAAGSMSASDKTKLDGATSVSTAGTLAYRGAAGTLAVKTPTLIEDAANKGYVDAMVWDGAAITTGTVVAARLPVSTGSVPGTMSAADKAKLDAATVAATASTIVIRDGNGAINIAATTIAGHAARKDYVDGMVWDGSDITTGTVDAARLPVATGTVPGTMSAADKALLDTVTYLATGAAIMRRHSTGTVQIATPTAAADATTKGYVDGLVSPKLTATKGTAVTNATVAADGTSAGTQLNALLASLRAANIIS